MKSLQYLNVVQGDFSFAKEPEKFISLINGPRIGECGHVQNAHSLAGLAGDETCFPENEGSSS